MSNIMINNEILHSIRNDLFLTLFNDLIILNLFVDASAM